MVTYKEIEARKKTALLLQYPGYLSELRMLEKARKALRDWRGY